MADLDIKVFGSWMEHLLSLVSKHDSSLVVAVDHDWESCVQSKGTEELADVENLLHNF